jgi:hypothetical protein
MIPALHDLEPLIAAVMHHDTIDQAVRATDAAGRPAVQGVLQRLRRTMTFGWSGLDVADQLKNRFEDPLVGLPKGEQVLPGSFGPCRSGRHVSAPRLRRRCRRDQGDCCAHHNFARAVGGRAGKTLE